MNLLPFRNPTFNSGRNVTVRLGDGWARRLRAGEDVGLWDYNTKETRPAVVLESEATKICDIPVDTLELCHEDACRTHEGLLAFLSRVYKRKVSSRDKVSVIAFEPRLAA